MLKMIINYLFYRIFAPHRKGFGIHSPFVFDLTTNVLSNDDDEKLLQIKEWRKQLLSENNYILTEDIGAGSKIHPNARRSFRSIIKRSSIRHKYGRILYYLALNFKPSTIVELGTGLGISTAYLMMGCPNGRIITVDADKLKITEAKRILASFNIKRPEFVHGSFDDLLLSKLNEIKHPLMFFIDGDHCYESLIGYFDQILKFAGNDTIIVIDDIRWSDEMKKAWESIKNDSRSILCIDLFFMGVVFFRDGMTKQNYIINI